VIVPSGLVVPDTDVIEIVKGCPPTVVPVSVPRPVNALPVWGSMLSVP
jgi:hypothetical protein